ASRGEPDVLPGERLPLGVVEGARDDLRGAFAKFLPRSRAIDRFAVDRQPLADLLQGLLLRLRDGAVRARPDIQQEGAVLADDVDQVADDLSRRLVVLLTHVAPGVLRDGRIGLPEVRPDASTLPALDLDHGALS